jgi:protein-disulfide isomerase
MQNDTKALVGIGIATLIVVVAGVFFITKSQNKPRELMRIKSDNLIRSDSHKNTAENTPVTIVEFGDFQCPACAGAFSTVEKILTDYNGKVSLVFRHFPLQQHSNSMIAAEAAESADQEGKFWMMYRLLYSNQDKWANMSDPMDEFLRYADEIKMDRNKFRKAVEEKRFEERIKRDENDGIALGVSATPTFFINGIRIQGAPTYGAFKEIIDSELGGK